MLFQKLDLQAFPSNLVLRAMRKRKEKGRRGRLVGGNTSEDILSHMTQGFKTELV